MSPGNYENGECSCKIYTAGKRSGNYDFRDFSLGYIEGGWLVKSGQIIFIIGNIKCYTLFYENQ